MDTQTFLAFIEQTDILPSELKQVLRAKTEAGELSPSQCKNIADSIQHTINADEAALNAAMHEAVDIQKGIKRDDRKIREEKDRESESEFLPEL